MSEYEDRGTPVKIELIHPDVIIPSYKHAGDSGMDVRAFFSDEWLSNQFPDTKGEKNRSTIIHPGQRQIIPTGIKVAIPVGYEIQVRPRSGLAIKEGLTVLNTPGTIDAGYRGEIGVILVNTNDYSNASPEGDSVTVSHGDRIAQLVLQKVPNLKWEFVDSVENDSTRAEGGFGSTGTS